MTSCKPEQIPYRLELCAARQNRARTTLPLRTKGLAARSLTRWLVSASASLHVARFERGAASMPLRLLAPLLLIVLTISCAVVSTRVLGWSRMLHEH